MITIMTRKRIKKRLNREMPYKPEVIHGSKRCQMPNCNEILKHKRYQEESRECDICDVTIKYACYSCLGGLHEYDVCKECYETL